MNNPFNIPRWLAQNPLGILALFILLIYGISALLLGLSIHDMEPINETILVLFIVVFPFVVLWVFAWLVSCHHHKLYGPSDFQNDSSFLAVGGPELDYSTVGKRLELATEEIEDDALLGVVNEKSEETNACSHSFLMNDELCPIHLDKRGFFQTDAYAAESLVFQDLQNEYEGGVRRSVTFVNRSSGKTPTKIMLDGVIENFQSIIGVEVVVVRSLNGLDQKVRFSLDRLVECSQLLTVGTGKNVRLLIAVVLGRGKGAYDLKDVEKRIFEYIQKVNLIIELKIYHLDELRDKYGFHISGGASYYINKNATAAGGHELHAANCIYLPRPENRVYIGVHASCREAMQEAKKHYDNVDVCYYCCNDCNTR